MAYKKPPTDPFPQPNNPAGFGKFYAKVFIPEDGDPNSKFTFGGILTLWQNVNWLAWRALDIRDGGAYDTSVNGIVINSGLWRFKDYFGVWGLVHENGSWPALDPPRTWERHSLKILSTSHEFTDAGEPRFALPDAWVTNQPGFRCIETRPTASSVQYTEILLDDLPDGGLLNEVKVTSQGNTSSATIILGSYRVGRFQGTGAVEWISGVVQDTHLDNATDWTDEKVVTVLSLGGHQVNKTYTYFVRAVHPSKVGIPANSIFIKDVMYKGTAARLGL